MCEIEQRSNEKNIYGMFKRNHHYECKYYEQQWDRDTEHIYINNDKMQMHNDSNIGRSTAKQLNMIPRYEL